MMPDFEFIVMVKVKFFGRKWKYVGYDMQLVDTIEEAGKFYGNNLYKVQDHFMFKKKRVIRLYGRFEDELARALKR